MAAGEVIDLFLGGHSAHRRKISGFSCAGHNNGDQDEASSVTWYVCKVQ